MLPDALLDLLDPDEEPDFSAICAYLQDNAPLSPAAWKALETALDEWQDDERSADGSSLDGLLRGQTPIFWPLVRHLDLSSDATPSTLAALASASSLSHLTILSLEDNPSLTLPDLLPVFANPHLSDLQTLDLSGIPIGFPGITALLDASFFPSLLHLYLNGCSFGDEGLTALLGSPKLRALETLEIDENRLTSSGMEILSNAKILREVTILSLGGNFITDLGLQHLAASPHLLQISSLALNETGLTEDGLRLLLASPKIRSLEELYLGGNPILDLGVEMIAKCPYLVDLQTLFLWETGMTASGIESLTRSRILSKITDLDLSYNPFGDRGLRTLARWRSLAKVTDLSLRSCEISPDGLETLLASAYLKEPFVLDLSENQHLGDKGLRLLVESAIYPSLGELYLSDCGITDLAVETLLDSAPPESLSYLDLSQNRISPRAQTRLAQSPNFRDLHEADSLTFE